MIRNLAQAIVLVLAFLLIVAEVQRMDDGSPTGGQHETRTESSNAPEGAE